MTRSMFLRIITLLSCAVLILAACSGDDDNESSSSDSAAATQFEAGIQLVTPETGAQFLENRSDELVLLDVRTPEEFGEGHIETAELIDFYRADFTDQIAALDRDVPYVVYCRSGNRSGQTAKLMESLGFTQVADIDGGILAWGEAGLAITPPEDPPEEAPGETETPDSAPAESETTTESTVADSSDDGA